MKKKQQNHSKNSRNKHIKNNYINKKTEKIISTLIIIIFIIASLILNKQENNTENQLNETNITTEQAQTIETTVATTIYNFSNIPAYTDKIYTEIKNNIP